VSREYIVNTLLVKAIVYFVGKITFGTVLFLFKAMGKYESKTER
jgi:hypothetical protein